ncbi:MAG: hypothetical protein DRI86_01190 [Bacteroidetes bacterium]|nr:MAG: hypothetical protein DRI86_01190 [Bacteroidota bacterium]
MNKPYIRTIFTFLLLSFINSSIFGQSEKLNSEKYWIYRDRLIHDFMLGIGLDNGKSFPFMERYRYSHSKSATLYWDDATIGHGYYIAILATEYKLLNDNHKNTEQTIRELFFALEALNNLDYKAETRYYDSNNKLGKPSLNGFFIRDLASDSMKKYTNYTWLNSNSNLLDVEKLYGGSLDNKPNDAIAEMSKDQVIFLMVGLRLVQKLIPENLSYIETNKSKTFRNSNNYFIRKEAVEIANRILKYISKNSKTAFPLVYYHWNIINPVTNNNVDRGFNAFSQALGFEKLYKTFNNQDSSLFTKIGEKAAAKLVSGGTKMLLNPVVKNGEGHMVLTLAAISNQWGKKTKRKLENKCFKNYKNNANYDYLVLLYSVLFDDTLEINRQPYFLKLLNSAPLNGPFNYNHNNEFANFEWSTSRRYTRPENRGENTQSHPGDYNGIGFMLLENLYNIYYHKTKNIMENSISLRSKMLANPYYYFEKHYYNIANQMPNTFNHSYTDNCIISDTLFINKNRKSEANYYSHLKLPETSSTFTLNLNKPLCNSSEPSLIKIDSSGVLSLGETTCAKKLCGIIRIKDGAALIIGKFSRLEMNANSKIIIEDGGQLIFEDYSNILLFDSSQIIVRAEGNLSISDESSIYLSNYYNHITFNKNSSSINKYKFLSNTISKKPDEIITIGKGIVIVK